MQSLGLFSHQKGLRTQKFLESRDQHWRENPRPMDGYWRFERLSTVLDFIDKKK